jgi:peptidoglycan/xylan/chitin deacetylase (PgdA/CDA1 family)
LIIAMVLGGCTHARPSASSSTPTTSTSESQPSPAASSSEALVPVIATPTESPTPTPSPSPTATAYTGPPPAGLLGQNWTRLPTDEKVVALTFDAGANADGVASILRTLAAEKVPATFFLTGTWVQLFPEQAAQIGAAGYRLANHSVTHPYFTQLSDAAMRKEVLDADAAITAAAGGSTAPWFRFPYGDRNAHTISVVNSLGFVPISWTVDTLGWQGTSSGNSVDQVVNRVLRALTPGEIVLMHVGSHADRSTLDADSLPRMISELRARGYTFTTIDALL